MGIMDHTEADIYTRVLEKIGYKIIDKCLNKLGNTHQLIFEKINVGFEKQIAMHFTKNGEKVILLRERTNKSKFSLLSKSIFEFTQRESFREAKIESIYDYL